MPETTDLRMCVTCGKMGGVCRWVDDPVPCMREQLNSLRRGLNEVRDFLNKPEWGTYTYMEGTGVYEDKDAALFNIAYALGETDAA